MKKALKGNPVNPLRKKSVGYVIAANHDRHTGNSVFRDTMNYRFLAEQRQVTFMAYFR